VSTEDFYKYKHKKFLFLSVELFLHFIFQSSNKHEENSIEFEKENLMITCRQSHSDFLDNRC